MLEVRGLGFRYPKAEREALADASFIAQPGRILGLLGPNGAGKTTLIALIAGLLPQQRGTILVGEQVLSDVRREAPTRIAVAPQEDAFYPMLTVRENLDCFAAAARIDGVRRRERIDACIAFGRLERHAAIRADRLSGGLRRRLNLAVSLLAEPQVILLDEPTAGVDPQSRAFLLESVRALAAAGATVVYTSHYMEEIEAIADQVVILDHGRVLRDGSLAELLAADGTRLTLRFDAPDAPEAMQLLHTYGEALLQGTTLTLTLDAQHTPAQVFAALETAALPVRQASYGGGNLEQLFMTLTHRSLRDS